MRTIEISPNCVEANDGQSLRRRRRRRYIKTAAHSLFRSVLQNEFKRIQVKREETKKSFRNDGNKKTRNATKKQGNEIIAINSFFLVTG